MTTDDLTTDDMTLARAYGDSGSQQAFAMLVSRYIDMVYSVALRTVGEANLADDVTQATFIILARKAGSLSPGTVLPGWLCRTARYVAANALTLNRRRHQYERQAAVMRSISNARESETWTQVSALLDAALGQLGKKDHDALVLRFFQGQNLKQVAAELGTSEDAARKRVTRALGKLRKFFTKHGVVLSTVIIAKAVSANAVQAAPVGLATSVTGAVADGTLASASTLVLVKGGLKLMAWAKLKIALAAVTAILLVTGTAAVVTLADGDGATATQRSEVRGALVLCGGGVLVNGGGQQNPITKRFVELAGGPSADFVIIRVPNSQTPKDDRPLADRVASTPDTKSAVAFGVKTMTALRFTARDAADSAEFVAPLRKANGVWITGGDLDILVSAGKDTLTHRELKAVLDRGGVVGGESAGALILTSQITKNIKGVPPGVNPDIDLDEGFGFVKDIVVVPHLLRMGWQENLVPVIAAHPALLGVGIDEGAAVVVQHGSFDVIGNSKVAIYDNENHSGKHYYFLSAGDHFDLSAHKPAPKVDKMP
jgi:cyanophycinase